MVGEVDERDPAGFVDGWNLFSYVKNSPISLRDDLGLKSDKPEGYTPIWTIKPNKAEQKVLGNPSSDPDKVLEIFKKHGYRGTGPVKWIEDKNSGVSGWLDTSVTVTKESGDGDGTSGTDRPPVPDPTPPAASQAPAPPSESSSRDAASVGSPLGQSPAGAERFIWQHYDPMYRGKVLEGLYGVPWGSNTKNWDLNLDTKVQQIKSTDAFDTVGNFTREATRDAAQAIKDNPTTMAGKRPQAVMITPTDAPAKAGSDIDTALNPGRGRKIPNNALPPGTRRGLPGAVGAIGKGLSIGGTALSGYALYDDIRRDDIPMAVGDALGTAGGGLELYAIASSGATLAGVSAMSAGLVLAGAGIAITSGISGYRAYRAGDTAGAVVGAVGVAAGVAIMAGVIFGAPLVLAAGLIAAVGVGLFHLGRWLLS